MFGAFIFFLFIDAEDYFLSSYTDKYGVTAEEHNTKTGHLIPVKVLDKIEPLKNHNGFNLFFLLPEKRIFHEMLTPIKVKFSYKEQVGDDYDEKLENENFEIFVTVSGGVIKSIKMNTVKDENTLKTEVTIICGD
jgi:hypothetical protein